ncbi:MAG TPA: hypothetical protein VIX60_07030 [Candidatus Cybelea sp.]
MFRIFVGLFALTLWASVTLCASAQEPPPPEGAPQAADPYAPNATATPAPNPAMLARAKTVFTQLQAGKIDRSQLVTDANANFTNATVANAQKMVGSLGKPVSFVQQQATTQGSVSAAIYVVTFKNGQKVDFLFALDSQGKIAGLSLSSPR